MIMGVGSGFPDLRCIQVIITRIYFQEDLTRTACVQPPKMPATVCNENDS